MVKKDNLDAASYFCQFCFLFLVLVETLERRGTLNSVRGQIRAEVFNALDDKTSAKPKPNNDTVLINELIREYLEYNNYNYASVTLREGKAIEQLRVY